MLRKCSLIILLVVLAPTAVNAQVTNDTPGWDVLADSLFLIWHLDQDQINRLHVIAEDYDTERQHVAANTKIDAAGKQARLRKLGTARLKEIKGVLGQEYFSDWQHLLREAASNAP